MSTITIPGVPDNSITNSLLRDSAALSVIGRSVNSSGDPGDLAAGTDAHVLRRSGTTLGFGTLTGASLANNAVSYSQWQQLAGFSIPARAVTGTGNAADLTAGTNAVLGRVAGDMAFAAIVNAQITAGTIATDRLADVSSDIILGRGTASAGPVEELTIGASLNLDALNLERAAISGDVVVPLDSNTATIQTAAVILAMQADVVQERLLGRGGASGTGPPELILIGSGLDLAAGTLSATGGGGGDTISVNGSATAATDVDFDDALPAAPAGGVNISWAKDALDPTNVSAHLAAGDVAYSVIQDISAASRVLGRGSAGGAGDAQELTLGASMNMDGVNIERAAISGDVVIPLDSNTATIQPASVELSMQADVVQERLLGRGGASGTGPPELILIGAGLDLAAGTLSATGGGGDKVLRIGHSYLVSGSIAVPSGQTDFIVPFTVQFASGQTANLVTARYSINAGTSVTLDVTRNGSNITGYTGISVTTTPATTTQTQALSSDDELAIVVSGVSGSPFNMSFTLFVEYTQ